MAAQSKCHCQSCTIRGLMGPAVVITVGVLWLLNEVHGGRLYFGSTWPVILIVIGLLQATQPASARQPPSARTAISVSSRKPRRRRWVADAIVSAA